MEDAKRITTAGRWIFRTENKFFRYTFVAVSVLMMLYYYGIYNLFAGSFFFFLFLYLVGTFKDRKKIDLLLNEDPVNVASKITNMINAARSEMKILSGSINPRVYCHDDIINAIDKALKLGVEISFITNWDTAKASSDNKVIEWARKNRLKIYDFGDNVDRINHFIVVDGKNFRVEGMHDKVTANRLAITAYNNRRAQKFVQFFDELISAKKVKLIYPRDTFSLV